MDGEEIVLGSDNRITNPNHRDTDADGVVDGSDLDPRDPNSDSDFDLISDLQETNGALNPWVAGVNTGVLPVSRPTRSAMIAMVTVAWTRMRSSTPWLPAGLRPTPTTATPMATVSPTGWNRTPEPGPVPRTPAPIRWWSTPTATAIPTGSKPPLAAIRTLPASTPVVPDLTTGLIGYWNFDGNLKETSGFRAAGVHDGLAVGAIQYSASVAPGLGQALDTTPAGNLAVKVLNTNASADGAGYSDTFDAHLNTTRKMSISFWAYQAPTPTWNPWLSKRGESDQGYQVRRHSGTAFGTLTLRGNPGADDPVGNLSIDAGQPKWLHVVAVWDGIAGTRKLYIDGVSNTLVATGDIRSVRAGHQLFADVWGTS